MRECFETRLILRTIVKINMWLQLCCRVVKIALKHTKKMTIYVACVMSNVMPTPTSATCQSNGKREDGSIADKWLSIIRIQTPIGDNTTWSENILEWLYDG